MEKTNNDKREKRNLSYIFIPFYYSDDEEYQAFVQKCKDSSEFNEIKDNYKYLFKYVTARMGDREYSHFLSIKSIDTDVVYSTFNKAEFKLLAADVYCFCTGVCILVFKIMHMTDDPRRISNNLFELKRIGTTKFKPKNKDGKGSTFLQLAEDYVGQQNFMYFENEEQERANILTYLEVDAPDDGSKDLPEFYKEDLFYLRNCYNSGYTYNEKYNVCSENEMHYHSESIIWGLSNEAAVCLTCPQMDKRHFIDNVFYKNFQQQYLSMYVLLLHQKYVLYMFLMEIVNMEDTDTNQQNQLKLLEEYKTKLFSFEKDFLFNCVSEVPQYQNLYTKLYKLFAIQSMEVDVHEPIQAIAEIKREQYEESIRKEDARQNGLLFILAILGVFSALVDSFDYIDKFPGMISNLDKGVHVAQLVVSLVIVLSVGIMFGVSKLNGKKK